jgi:Chitobiase/beta-hexosaminidase C-terminal domain
MTARPRAAVSFLPLFGLAACPMRAAQNVEVAFDHPGGFCESDFALSLSMPVDAAAIFYTANGILPQPQSATRYVRPIAITATTIFRPNDPRNDSGRWPIRSPKR